MRRRLQGADGFSLLEVMIAVAVVAIALVTLLGLSNRTVLVQERVQKITRATLLAQQILSEREVGGVSSLYAGNTEGEFEPPFEDFRWHIRYEDTLLAQVKLIHVSVLWGRAESNELVELTSFVAAESVW